MKHKKWIWVGGSLLAAVLVVWLLWGNSALVTTQYTLTSEKLPQTFDGFQIVQISDLHNRKFGADNRKLLERIKQTQPDMIVITGDLVDSRRTDVQTALTFAERAAKIAPTYYVPGNHEARIDRYEELKAGLYKAGVTVLENEKVTLSKDGRTISLLGVVDPSFTTDYLGEEETYEMAQVLKELTEETDFQILLSHRPELFGTYVDAAVDVVFSGHSHGGQIRLPFIGGLFAPGQGFFPAYDGGVYTRNGTAMVVSRGLGNSLFPVRVNNRPQIVALQLKTRTGLTP